MAETTKVTETSSQGLEPTNLKLASQYDQLRSLLEARLSPDHAFLFAEPVPFGGNRAGGKDTAWYVKGAGTVRALSSLPPELIPLVEHRVATLVYDIEVLCNELIAAGGVSRELAKLLQDALIFPDDREVFLVDDRPVLVNWGYRKQAGGLSSGVGSGSIVSGKARSAPPPPSWPTTVSSTSPSASAASAGATKTQTENEQPTNTIPPAPVANSRRRSGWRWWGAAALWSAFVVLLGLSGLRLLDACALGLSNWPAFMLRLLPSQCPAAGNPDLQSINDAAKAIEASIRQKQLIVAAKIAQCDKTCPAPAPQPIRQTVEPPRTVPDLDRIIEQIHPPRGKIELTVAWKGRPDLDLHVHCPNGEIISYKQKAACGGVLTEDLNAGKGGTPGSDYIEHVYWNDIPQPPGRYTVSVVLFHRHEETLPGIPFAAVLRVNGVTVKEKASTLSDVHNSGTDTDQDTVFTFDVPSDVVGVSSNAR